MNFRKIEEIYKVLKVIAPHNSISLKTDHAGVYFIYNGIGESKTQLITYNDLDDIENPTRYGNQLAAKWFKSVCCDTLENMDTLIPADWSYCPYCGERL